MDIHVLYVTTTAGGCLAVDTAMATDCVLFVGRRVYQELASEVLCYP